MEKYEENYSENEDDPEVYESSGEEWAEEKEEKKRSNRRSSQRLSKKPKVSHVELSSDEDEDVKPKSKNGIKRQKVDDSTDSNDSSSPTPTSNKNNVRKVPAPGSKINASDFVNGGFLILKKDAQLGDSNKQPCLWRIDGKALLQKYEPFEEDGAVKHRNTSIYTGWSAMDKDLYYPVTVKVLQHQGQNMTVELNWEKLKELNNESE
ncbi:hypothetical protein ILUMI_25226 [Ignelater luminosus]|uniref:Uncharacterized protein n=1 Tax=Ignelater luminosus TaxID=2038154 RepID=A0A8K0CC33_IGNLU|nr:hypothetical protein ILUMI_25226 [Ignelater luminosus]